MTHPPVSAYLRRHFRHFNAAVVIEAADAWRALLDEGGRMMVTLAGAMSTAELGLSLAEMIRCDKVHAVTCTGANLEEDLFGLVGRPQYVPTPGYRDLTPQDERGLAEQGLSRITDVCVPMAAAAGIVERAIHDLWVEAERRGERSFPHEFAFRLVREQRLAPMYAIDASESWVVAAAERNIPLFVPGWEDSTLGNAFAARLMRGDLKNPHTVRSGVEYMVALADWYMRDAGRRPTGFFQIGGGIAGDFPICVVPMLSQDLGRSVPRWRYFCQISDSTTSYGSYSGAVPNEKITWGKLDVDTPRFIIESDATIVAPLVFALVLGH
jgi:deoxyhypusine synthase